MKRHDSISMIETLIHNDDYSEAERLLREEISRNPSDHWLHDRLSCVLHEQRRYCEAHSAAQDALKLMPDCPLALWDLAGALFSLDQDSQAASIWRRMLRRGERWILSNPCNEGHDWGRGLLNDCRLRLADYYWRHENRRNARRLLAEYHRRRARGIPSAYDKAEIAVMFDPGRSAKGERHG